MAKKCITIAGVLMAAELCGWMDAEYGEGEGMPEEELELELEHEQETSNSSSSQVFKSIGYCK